ncbi:cytochrome b561 and DOMON domain-containing protein At5g47530-like [Aristolochia californica]|uniref:cytochrome b561 and DOMON domain-containing protein At5g47530-like n=1 Tax=Aristolochia californica TaxID=171875 RepID=UPI0035E365FF
MGEIFKPIFIFCLLFSLFLSSASAQTCRSQSFSNRLYPACNDLPYLGSFLHWTYSAGNGSVAIAYRAPLSSAGWIAWAINPTGKGMRGAEAIVGVLYSNGSSDAYTTQITSYTPSMQRQRLSFAVTNIKTETDGGSMTIFADVELPNGRTNINQVWQQGPISGETLESHPFSGGNTQSSGTLDLLSGQGAASEDSRVGRKNVHGVLSALSWGTLMPLGAVIARYVKVFKSADPAWFYLHVACQSSAYIVGVAGWGMGLKLGSDSAGVTQTTHRNIGITLFVLGTLQVFALLLRPKKDHKYRFYWNIYHHFVGYTVIVLSVINVFKGLDILDPSKNWKRAYIGILIALGVMVLVLEAVTWPIVIKRKRGSSNKSHHGANGANGVNGYGGRHPEGV